jgi:hypothetical protein
METKTSGHKGAIITQQVTNLELALISQMKDQINAKLGSHHDSFDIISVSGQLIAGSTNKYFHLRGKPGNKDYTITIHIPASDKPIPEITETSCGHQSHQ